MASQFAVLLAAPSADEDDNPNEDAVAWCDHQLQEVREVLGHLLNVIDGANLPSCPECQRARELMKRVEIPKPETE